MENHMPTSHLRSRHDLRTLDLNIGWPNDLTNKVTERCAFLQFSWQLPAWLPQTHSDLCDLVDGLSLFSVNNYLVLFFLLLLFFLTGWPCPMCRTFLCALTYTESRLCLHEHVSVHLLGQANLTGVYSQLVWTMMPTSARYWMCHFGYVCFWG
jgi:hypothetical protein